MFKLYFKKLILVLCTFLMWLAISVTLATIFGLANDIGINYAAYTLCMVVSVFITAILVGLIKVKDNLSKIDYLTECELQHISFYKEVLNILKSKPFIAEALGFASWLVPLMAYVCCFPENADTPLYRLILISLLVITGFTFVFILLDLAITFIVRKIWLRRF